MTLDEYHKLNLGLFETHITKREEFEIGISNMCLILITNLFLFNLLGQVQHTTNKKRKLPTT